MKKKVVSLMLSALVATVLMGTGISAYAEDENTVPETSIETSIETSEEDTVIENEEMVVEDEDVNEVAAETVAFKINSDGLIEGFASEQTEPVVNFVIPEKVGDVDVKGIAPKAFENSKLIGSASGFATVTIPKHVKTIGNNAFSRCEYIKEVVFEDGTDTIEYTDSVNGAYAFSDCSNLEKVTLSNRIKTIPGGAFRKDVKLTTVVWSTALESIDEYAFEETAVEFAKLDKNTSLKSIAKHAFCNIENLKTVTFPKSLETIGESAFERSSLGGGTEGVSEVVIPASVTKIGLGAFKYTKYLETVVFEESDKPLEFGKFQDGSSAFAYCESLKKVVMTDRITEIPNHTFYKDPKLTDVTWSKKIKLIGDYAFSETAVKSADLSGCKELKSIGANAFEKNQSLEVVKFPSGLESIATAAFVDTSMGSATAPLTLTIPNTVVKIGHSAFGGTKYLKEVIFEEGEGIIDFEMHPVHGSAAFSKGESLEKVTFSKKFQAVPFNFCAECPKLTNIVLSDTVKSIDEKAFAKTNIKTLDLSKFTNIKTIGNCAFLVCPELTYVVLPPNLETIGAQAFQGCPLGSEKALGHLDIPGTVKKIDPFAFDGCKYLGEVFFGDSTGVDIEWGKGAVHGHYFANCENLVGIKLSTFCKNVPDDAFEKNKNFKHLVIPMDNFDITKYKFIEPENSLTVYCNKDSETYNKAKGNVKAIKSLQEVPSTFLKETATAEHVIEYDLGVSDNSVQNHPKNKLVFGGDKKIKTIKLYKLKRTGYVFKNWYIIKEDGTKVKVKSISKKLQKENKDIKLYAEWTPIKYKVAFVKGTKGNTKGVKGKIKKISAEYDKTFKLPDVAESFTREGYVFIGWSDSKKDNTVKYKPGQDAPNLTTKNKKTVKLYAVWQQVSQ